jgi:excisionase family DNA binding protein
MVASGTFGHTWRVPHLQAGARQQDHLQLYRRKSMIKPLKLGTTERPTAPRLLTIKDVAERLQASPRTIHRVVANGDLTVIRIGRAVRVSEEALRAFLTQEDQS